MTTYMIGNLLGRLVMAYGVVWVGSLVVSKFKIRRAFRLAHSWIGLSVMLVLLVVGIARLV